jgi:hypothetical protein
MHTTMHRANQIDVEKPPAGPLTFIEKGKAQQEALHIAATRGGLIMIRGREMQPKGFPHDLQRSSGIEGLLWQISEHVTRRAQVAAYRRQGLTKHETIKAVWKVEEGPLYEEACAEYREIVTSLERNI